LDVFEEALRDNKLDNRIKINQEAKDILIWNR
jgi:hypothetical protein